VGIEREKVGNCIEAAFLKLILNVIKIERKQDCTDVMKGLSFSLHASSNETVRVLNDHLS
jgi:hypothetical protein